MSKWGQGVVTNKGLERIAASHVGEPLTLTKMAMGEGLLGSTNPATLVELMQKVLEVPLLEAKELPMGTIQVRADVRPEDIPKDFYWREVGIYAKGADGQEVLYAYNYAGNNASFIPHGGLDTIAIQFPVSIGNALNVSVKLDESAAYVLRSLYVQKMDEVDARIEAALSYVAYLFALEIAPEDWTQNEEDEQHYATVPCAGILLGGYVYTAGASPETMRASAEAGGVLMLTPTAEGEATFTVPEVPETAIVMLIKREVMKEEETDAGEYSGAE